MTLTCASQVPMGKLGLAGADDLPGLLAELELEQTPCAADGKRGSPSKAALWRQGPILELLYLDALAAREAAFRCSDSASGTLLA